ncbi:MAG: alpha-glucan family phosphorylase [Nitrospira sp.]|nr:alpha-glucan family phosphorylase [Nitrospira sp.]
MPDGLIGEMVGAKSPLVAYFSMEIGLSPGVPTYAGGLGVLAGDTIRSAADIRLPLVAVTLLYRGGHFFQRLDEHGTQSEEPVKWVVEDFLEPLDPTVQIELEGRTVHIGVWRYVLSGETGHQVSIYFLDTDLPENSEWDRSLTGTLYGGDQRYRLCQEALLGFGGMRMLQALGHRHIGRFHLNEGHASLLVLGLLEEELATVGVDKEPSAAVVEAVRPRCVFTTHTPVPAGHDQFPSDMAERVLGARYWRWLQLCGQTQTLNMTALALSCSRYVNGVAMKHGEVSQSMFPGYPVHSITNGVHATTWMAPSFKTLFDRHLPDWRRDPLTLRYTVGVPAADIWAAHDEAKRRLIEFINHETNEGFDVNVFTIGFARRAATYKRLTLLFHDLDRLKAIAQRAGRFQLVFAGKAHPKDHGGKELIRLVHRFREALHGHVPVVYLRNYDMVLAKLLCAGVDVWLNTPLPPHEASGTSGMKAAMNGVPSFSVLDGWWIEGHIEGVTGWSIGDRVEACLEPSSGMDACHASALYDKLEQKVLPCFYKDRDHFIDMMRQTIAVNGSFFNTHRMLAQYVNNAYSALDEYFSKVLAG